MNVNELGACKCQLGKRKIRQSTRLDLAKFNTKYIRVVATTKVEALGTRKKAKIKIKICRFVDS